MTLSRRSSHHTPDPTAHPCSPPLTVQPWPPVGGDDAFAGGGAVLATAGVAFFTTGLAALRRAADFAGSLPQKLKHVHRRR